MKKQEQDLEFSDASRAKLAHSFSSGCDWKSFRVGVTSRQLRRMKARAKATAPKAGTRNSKGF
jgi:hypothetical protein